LVLTDFVTWIKFEVCSPNSQGSHLNNISSAIMPFQMSNGVMQITHHQSLVGGVCSPVFPRTCASGLPLIVMPMCMMLIRAQCIQHVAKCAATASPVVAPTVQPPGTGWSYRMTVDFQAFTTTLSNSAAVSAHAPRRLTRMVVPQATRCTVDHAAIICEP
jgi:hypothetical protein